MKIFPRLLAVFVGIFAGGLLIWFIQLLGQNMYPPPAGLDIKDKIALAAYINNAPLGSKLFVVLAYALGAFLAGFITQLISRSRNLVPSLLSGAVLLAAGISTMRSIPHPTWMVVLSLSAFLPFAYFGAFIIRKTPPKTP